MNETTVIELVLFNLHEGVTIEEAKASLKELNKIVEKEKGFISRKTAISNEGQFLDVIYWKDLEAAKIASKNILKNEKATKIFSIIKQEEMIFNHFKTFNTYQ